MGIATGFYWPAVELAVPTSCGDFPSRKGFALVRSADALGISLGALIGSIAASTSAIRSIYLVDTSCMLLLLFLLAKEPLIIQRKEKLNMANKPQEISQERTYYKNSKWLNRLLPVLAISLLSTGIFSLLQSALPIDLVRGGLSRPPLNESWSSGLIALQLGLLVCFQWPVGRWLSDHNIRFGLGVSLSNFGLGCLLLSCSALWHRGVLIALIAQIPLALAIAAFLPTATEAVIQIAPINKRGLAMALFSQCFAISSFLAPIFAGRIMDIQGHGSTLWILMSISCITMLPILKAIQYNSMKVNPEIKT